MRSPDLASNERQASFLKRAMSAAGMVPDFNAAIAHISGSYVRDHAHFSCVLTEMEPELRHEMYETMRPHLKFAALPFDKYISMAKEMAEREQLPILSADGKLLEFRPAHDVATGVRDAQAALEKSLADRTLILHCSKCTATEAFYGHTNQSKIDVVIKARRAGWIYDGRGESPLEICPNCETSLRSSHEAHYGKHA